MALKFKTGDRVRFLNDIGGGVVSHIDEDGIIFVQSHDGFEIPISPGELIHDKNFNIDDRQEPEIIPDARMEKPAKSKPADLSGPSETIKLPANISPDAPVNILLGFIPEEPGPVFKSPLACYLINDSPYYAYFSAGSWERGNYYHLSYGIIESQTKNLITVFNQTSVSKISGLHVQLILLSKGRYSRKLPIDVLVDVQTVNFSKESYYHDNEFFDEKAILFPVTGSDEWVEPMGRIEVTESIKALKSDQISRKDLHGKKEIEPDTMEIDLHLDEPEMQRNQFSLSGILALQMSRFHSAIEEAVSKKFRRLVIIHGVGQGTLKMQIRKELQEKYPEFVFQDASFREYGFGATMVHLISDRKQ